MCFALIVTNICTTWSSGRRSKMIAGTVNCSSAKFSMSACRASNRCCPSIARRTPSRSGTFSRPSRLPGFDRLERQLLVGGDDDGAGNRRQIARLPALLVVLDELFDLAADDVALIRLLARRDAPLEQVPADLRLRCLFLAAPHRRLCPARCSSGPRNAPVCRCHSRSERPDRIAPRTAASESRLR